MKTKLDQINIRVISRRSVEYIKDADMITIPGYEGELGIMYGHERMIVDLKEGEIRIYENNSIIHSLRCDGGVAKITPQRIDVLLNN
jgi:F-type H+-transporting ATPase subunit epsilon